MQTKTIKELHKQYETKKKAVIVHSGKLCGFFKDTGIKKNE